MNNASLAVALQAEKEKVRQANAVILQLKREQQALFLHLLLFRRKVKEQEAIVAEVRAMLLIAFLHVFTKKKSHFNVISFRRISQIAQVKLSTLWNLSGELMMV